MKTLVFALAVALQAFLAPGAIAAPELRQAVQPENRPNQVAAQQFVSEETNTGTWGYLVLLAWLLSLAAQIPRKQGKVIPWKSVEE